MGQSILSTGKMRTKLHPFIILLLCIFILDIVEAEVRQKARGCKNIWKKRPKFFPKGKILTKGCLKYTCTEPRPRKFAWETELARHKCCSFNETFYPYGTTLLSKRLPDECTTVHLRCKKKEVFTEIEIDVEDKCPERPGIMNVLTTPSETIKSARFPSPFLPNQDECWMRTPTCGHFVQLEFVDFNVLGKDAFVTIDPPVNGQSKFFGNNFNYKMAPPKTVDFPHDHAVKVCFYSGSVVDGHKGFKAEITERKNNDFVTSPNYPEDINDGTFMDPPPRGYSPAIHHCSVRAPAKGRSLEMEFHQFDINAPPETGGDWITINPNPTKKEKYYGINLDQKFAPPRHHVFGTGEIVSICFKTRDSVDKHDGYVAEIYQEMGPTTMDMEPPVTDYTSYYNTYYTDYTWY